MPTRSSAISICSPVYRREYKTDYQKSGAKLQNFSHICKINLNFDTKMLHILVYIQVDCAIVVEMIVLLID